MSSIIPVIAGLVIGIAFIITFSILATSFQGRTNDSVIVVIPEGSHNAESEHNNFEPAVITVAIGVNNTVTWVNQDLAPVGIRAGDTIDPDFFKATENSGILGPNETFSFTFAKPGNFTYYSVPGPHRQGAVTVLALSDADGQPESRKVEFKTTYNSSRVPDMHLVVDNGKRYAGDEGSSCWDNVCEDILGEMMDGENTIVLDRGSEIEFAIMNFRDPDVLTITIDNEPSLYQCVTNETTGETRCGPPEGFQPPELTQLDEKGFRNRVDVLEGDYMIIVGAVWNNPDGSQEGSAGYYYKIRVAD